MSISRPLMYGGLALVLITALWATGSEPVKKVKASDKKPVSKKSLDQAWDFSEEETSVRFNKPQGNLRNVFKPLFTIEKPAMTAEEMQEKMKLPASVAGGEADWAYTGMVEIDGVKLALLENGTTHQGGYVREGEIWKKSRIVRITMANLLIAGPDGTEETVYRYNPNAVPKVKAPHEPGFRPLDVNPALKGPIGLEIRPTPPIPSGAADSSEMSSAPEMKSDTVIKKGIE